MDSNNQKLVTVVVPVYRAEQYIARCISSILHQTHQNLELILVDDGSPDRSGEICEEYALQDSRIKVIHTPNCGVSHARNTGISHANGEYLFFVDADDWVGPDHIRHMLPQNDEDFVYVGYTREFPDGKTDVVRRSEASLFVHEGNRDFIKCYQVPFVFCGCFKTELCRKNKVAFDEKLAVGEDVRFNLQYLTHCQNIRFIDRADYHYCQNPGSVVNRYHPDKLEQQISEVMALEAFMGEEDMQLRWYRWSAVRNHYTKWMHSQDVEDAVKREARQRLKATYRNAFFRSCLQQIRSSGSLDQKIESYFMSNGLHRLYAPVFRAVLLLASVKKRLLHG